MSVETHTRLAPHVQDELEHDPLAGEDELWAEEDFLLAPDAEDYVKFLRTLWVALLACAVFWVTIAVGAVQVLGAG
jgi:hypothetical protein